MVLPLPRFTSEVKSQRRVPCRGDYFTSRAVQALCRTPAGAVSIKGLGAFLPFSSPGRPLARWQPLALSQADAARLSRSFRAPCSSLTGGGYPYAFLSCCWSALLVSSRFPPDPSSSPRFNPQINSFLRADDLKISLSFFLSSSYWDRKGFF